MTTSANSRLTIASAAAQFFFVLFPAAAASPPQSPTLDLQVATAKTAYLTTKILYSKGEKSSSKLDAELNSILTIAGGTKIWSIYRPASAEKAQIIIKIIEDRSSGAAWTLTLQVYAPEDGSEE